jgi:ArsR family transcriptional regulator
MSLIQQNNPNGTVSEHELARMMNALAHPARIQILRYLSSADGCCCKDVVGQFGLAQSTVSQHLKILVDAGFLLMRPDGQKSRYAINQEALQRLALNVNDLVAASGPCCQAREEQI